MGGRPQRPTVGHRVFPSSILFLVRAVESKCLYSLLHHSFSPISGSNPTGRRNPENTRIFSALRPFLLLLSPFHRNTVQFPTTLSLHSAPFQVRNYISRHPDRSSPPKKTTLRANISSKSQPCQRTSDCCGAPAPRTFRVFRLPALYAPRSCIPS
jgi:hypothetical protein